MSLQVESLFTAALGLQAPWKVAKDDLDTAKRRIDFEVISTARRLGCPSCGAADQGVHDRVRRDWRHLDFFQFEAWLHADITRIGCMACGKTTQVPVRHHYEPQVHRWHRRQRQADLRMHTPATPMFRDEPF